MLINSCYDQYNNWLSNYYNTVINERSESNTEVIVNFLIEVHKKIGLAHIGDNWIQEYLVFQFNYWIDKQVQFGDKITIKKVFALASFERFNKRPGDFNWFMAKKQVGQYFTLEVQNNRVSSEELEKQRFHNTRKGIGHCMESTTLYNHRSSICTTCKFKGVCKKLLKVKYPKLYIKRGYEKNIN